MTARESTVVAVDAATVYAEGVLVGLRMACMYVGRDDAKAIPPGLSKAVTEWRANVIHREWLAQQGRPLTHEQSAEGLAFIHNVLRAAGIGASSVY